MHHQRGHSRHQRNSRGWPAGGAVVVSRDPLQGGGECENPVTPDTRGRDRTEGTIARHRVWNPITKRRWSCLGQRRCLWGAVRPSQAGLQGWCPNGKGWISSQGSYRTYCCKYSRPNRDNGRCRSIGGGGYGPASGTAALYTSAVAGGAPRKLQLGEEESWHQSQEARWMLRLWMVGTWEKRMPLQAWGTEVLPQGRKEESAQEGPSGRGTGMGVLDLWVAGTPVEGVPGCEV